MAFYCLPRPLLHPSASSRAHGFSRCLMSCQAHPTSTLLFIQQDNLSTIMCGSCALPGWIKNYSPCPRGAETPVRKADNKEINNQSKHWQRLWRKQGCWEWQVEPISDNVVCREKPAVRREGLVNAFQTLGSAGKQTLRQEGAGWVWELKRASLNPPCFSSPFFRIDVSDFTHSR